MTKNQIYHSEGGTLMEALIERSRQVLAQKHNVSINNLVYIGYSDCSCIRGAGAVSVNFNIIKEGHKHHRSTVAINSWNL